MVCQHRGAFPRGQIPEANRRVRGACDDLGVRRLAGHSIHSTVMAAEDEDFLLRPHVPHARHRVSPARHKYVQRGVEGQAVDAGQVAVV